MIVSKYTHSYRRMIKYTVPSVYILWVVYTLNNAQNFYESAEISRIVFYGFIQFLVCEITEWEWKFVEDKKIILDKEFAENKNIVFNEENKKNILDKEFTSSGDEIDFESVYSAR